jgi:KTSC domain
MAREYVESTSIEWFEYDEREKALDLAFVGGEAYRYHGVPARVCDGLRAAESKGRYVNVVIKPRYTYTPLGSRRGGARRRGTR